MSATESVGSEVAGGASKRADGDNANLLCVVGAKAAAEPARRNRGRVYRTIVELSFEVCVFVVVRQISNFNFIFHV